MRSTTRAITVLSGFPHLRVKDIVIARATLNLLKTSAMTISILRANKYTSVGTCIAATSIHTNEKLINDKTIISTRVMNIY
jgi:hypothetical protein